MCGGGVGGGDWGVALPEWHHLHVHSVPVTLAPVGNHGLAGCSLHEGHGRRRYVVQTCHVVAAMRACVHRGTTCTALHAPCLHLPIPRQVPQRGARCCRPLASAPSQQGGWWPPIPAPLSPSPSSRLRPSLSSHPPPTSVPPSLLRLSPLPSGPSLRPLPSTPLWFTLLRTPTPPHGAPQPISKPTPSILVG